MGSRSRCQVSTVADRRIRRVFHRTDLPPQGLTVVVDRIGVVEEERTIATLQQAALLLDMSPNTIADWRDSQKLGPAPWSAAELWAVKNRRGAPFRRRGITSQHGTISRFNAGCRCDPCLLYTSPSPRDRS